MLVRALLVFVCAVVLDALWALYIRRSAQGQALQASTYATVLLGLGAFNTLSFLDNRWMLIPAAAGAFLGTYVTVVWERSRKDASAVERLIRETSEHAIPVG